MNPDCDLIFCLEDWGVLGFAMVLLPIAIGVVIGFVALHVRCPECAESDHDRGLLFPFKRRGVALVDREYLGEREYWVDERRSSHTTSRHWDSSGHFSGTSESTTTWFERVPRVMSVYRYFFECPDCGYEWTSED